MSPAGEAPKPVEPELGGWSEALGRGPVLGNLSCSWSRKDLGQPSPIWAGDPGLYFKERQGCGLGGAVPGHVATKPTRSLPLAQLQFTHLGYPLKMAYLAQIKGLGPAD